MNLTLEKLADQYGFAISDKKMEHGVQVTLVRSDRTLYFHGTTLKAAETDAVNYLTNW